MVDGGGDENKTPATLAVAPLQSMLPLSPGCTKEPTCKEQQECCDLHGNEEPERAEMSSQSDFPVPDDTAKHKATLT